VAGNVGSLRGSPLADIKQVCYVRTPSESSADGVCDMFVEIIRGGLEGATEVAVLCRCSHNGYYGGWLEWALYPGVQVAYEPPVYKCDARYLEDEGDLDPWEEYE
jgi:hypothetical protein